jgi:hypothetical protein
MEPIRRQQKLTLEQRLKLVEWTAELLDLQDINQRAAKEDPPFVVSWTQLKHARRRLGVNIARDRAGAIAEAVARGVTERQKVAAGELPISGAKLPESTG